MLHRLFIAVDLPDAVRGRLARLVADAPRGVRPVRPGQIHLTLHFLGDVDDAMLAAVCAGLPRVARPVFPIDLAGTGVFPPRGRPAVLWVGVVENAALRSLHRDVADVLSACGLAVERRPWVPHVTLARLAPHVPRTWPATLLTRTATLAEREVPVTVIRLYESTRTPEGPVHVAAATVPLKPAGRPLPPADVGR